MDLVLEGRTTPADEEDVCKIGDALIAKGFIVRAHYQPLIEKADSSKKKKWPDRLVRKPAEKFDPEGYYITVYEGSQTWR